MTTYSSMEALRKGAEKFLRSLRYDIDCNKTHASFFFSEKNGKGDSINSPGKLHQRQVYSLYENVLLRLQSNKWKLGGDLMSIGWFAPCYLELNTEKLKITVKVYKVEWGHKVYLEWVGPGWEERVGEIELTMERLPCLSISWGNDGWQYFASPEKS